MGFWEWYRRTALCVVAVMLILITIRLYASPTLFPGVYRHVLTGAIPVYIMGGNLDVEVTNTARVEVTNTPLEVEVNR